MSELVPISYFHEDILEDSSLDELVYLYAERVYKQEDCSSPEDFLEQVIAIEYFPDVTFHSLLEEYFEEQGKDIEDEVRGYVPHKSGFLMTHRCAPPGTMKRRSGGCVPWMSMLRSRILRIRGSIGLR